MHEGEAARLGLNYVYRLIDTDALGFAPDALPELIAAAERCGFSGLNITHPFKQSAVAQVDELSPESEEIGAINTIVFGGGKRIGHNTDCRGFAESFRRGMPGAALGSVLMIGAGGAGAAVARALCTLGAGRLAIFDIDRTKASALAARVARSAPDCRVEATHEIEPALESADGLVNATPVGMADHRGLPVKANLLRSSMWVADIVYVPVRTGLLRAARAAGCRTLSGAGMAAEQAARAFELFSGVTPDPVRMLALVEQ